MRDGSEMSNVSDGERWGVERRNSRLGGWRGRFKDKLEIVDGVLFEGVRGRVWWKVRWKGSGFGRRRERGRRGCWGREGVRVRMSDSEDGVVERRMDMREGVRELFC